MTWFALAPAVLVTCAVLFGAGVPLALTLRLRGFDAAAVAPALGVTVVAVSAVVAAPLGLRWSWWIPLLAAALLTAALLVAVRPRGGDRERLAPTEVLREDAHAWAGAALGAALGVLQLLAVLGRPDAFSQTFDNIFHLSTTRVVVETGVASSLLLNGALNTPPTTGFYPAAFHDLAALATTGAPDRLTTGMNGLLLVLVALVWPLGVVFAVRTLTRATPAALVSTGALSAAFPAFPLLLLDFGVLYPNLMGLTLLPVAVGLVAQLLRLAPTDRVTRPQAIVLGVGIVPGMALAHPNVVLTLALISAPWMLVRIGRLVRRAVVQGEATDDGHRTGAHASSGRSAWIEAGVIAAVLAALVVVWPRLRPSEFPWDPIQSHTDAAGHALLNATPVGHPAWTVSALMVVGILAAARFRMLWLVAGWVALVVFWIVVASWPAGDLRDLLTGVWYNDPFRLSAALPVLALPLAALGVSRLTRWPADGPGRAHSVRPLVVGVVLPVVAAALVLATTQPAGYLTSAVERAAGLYRITPTSPLVDSDEWALLNRLTEHVGPDDVVATNPWNGSSLAYAVAGVNTTTKHVFYDTTPELDLVNAELDEAAGDAAVCAAVRELGVTHALDFGTREVHGGTHPYTGLLDLAESPGFERVDAEGAAVLYRVTACG
ncbi:MAG TPA: hypothetical protein GXZ45_09035 [Propionibacterium sp.]|nr:hypothetical protein [Propionibacterium sp.]